MNKIKHVAIVILALAATTACKKYEEGPLVSLRSKTNRLTGEWKVVEMITKDVGYSGTETRSFDGDMIVVTNDDTTMVYPYKATYKIDKDGTFEYEEVSDQVFEKSTDNWSFADGSSNKSMLLLDGVYRIIKLSNKELKLEYAYSYSDTYGVYNPETQQYEREPYTRDFQKSLTLEKL